MRSANKARSFLAGCILLCATACAKKPAPPQQSIEESLGSLGAMIKDGLSTGMRVQFAAVSFHQLEGRWPADVEELERGGRAFGAELGVENVRLTTRPDGTLDVAYEVVEGSYRSRGSVHVIRPDPTTQQSPVS